MQICDVSQRTYEYSMPSGTVEGCGCGSTHQTAGSTATFRRRRSNTRGHFAFSLRVTRTAVIVTACVQFIILSRPSTGCGWGSRAGSSDGGNGAAVLVTAAHTSTRLTNIGTLSAPASDAVSPAPSAGNCRCSGGGSVAV